MGELNVLDFFCLYFFILKVYEMMILRSVVLGGFLVCGFGLLGGCVEEVAVVGSGEVDEAVVEVVVLDMSTVEKGEASMTLVKAGLKKEDVERFDGAIEYLGRSQMNLGGEFIAKAKGDAAGQKQVIVDMEVAVNKLIDGKSGMAVIEMGEKLMAEDKENGVTYVVGEKEKMSIILGLRDELLEDAQERAAASRALLEKRMAERDAAKKKAAEEAAAEKE